MSHEERLGKHTRQEKHSAAEDGRGQSPSTAGPGWAESDVPSAEAVDTPWPPRLRLWAPQLLPKEPAALNDIFCSWKRGCGARSTPAGYTGRSFPKSKALHSGQMDSVSSTEGPGPQKQGDSSWGTPCSFCSFMMTLEATKMPRTLT